MRSTYRVGMGKETKHSMFEITVKGSSLDQFGFAEVVSVFYSGKQHSGFDDCMNWIKTQNPAKTYIITEYPQKWDNYKKAYAKDYKNKTVTEI